MRFAQWSGLLLAAVVVVSAPSAALAQQWGSIQGQIVLDGEIPQLPPLVKIGDTKVQDPAVCSVQGVPDESLVVDPESKGIANVYVYLRRAPAVHPDLQKSAEESVVFDQEGCRFLPHALVVRTDQKVLVKSGDPVAHNTQTNTLRNAPVNFVVQANERTGVPVSVNVPEPLPTQVKCSMHPWMTAYWLIVDHPYAVATNEQGEFTIENLPAGEHELTVWQERVGYLDRAYKVTVKPGETTKLEPMKVAADRFK